MRTKTTRCARCFEKIPSDDPCLVAVGDDDLIMCGECEEEREAPVEPLDVEAAFAPGGPLAAGNPAYEARPGQVRLARAIHDALVDRHHLLAEGPCGIGKSKAYGVPAAHLAAQGKRVMIVTASIALQEQLVRKDLPALRREMPEPFTFELLKGRGNYLCVEQLRTADSAGLTYDDRMAFDAVSSWAAKTETGDRTELLIKPSDLVWGKFAMSPEACPRTKCASYEECYATQARERASQAGIIVTNYHLLFLNIASGGKILPLCDVLILDEAHEAADIARELLGFKVGEHTFRRIARDADKKGAPELGLEIREAAAEFFAKLLRFYDCPFYDKKIIRAPLPFDCDKLATMVQAYAETFPRSHLVDSALRAVGTIRAAITVADSNCVYSIDAPPKDQAVVHRRAMLVARYISPAGILNAQLWPAYQSVVAVSATITTDGKFDFVRSELGAPKDAHELVVESPFDFGRQALLVVPPAAELPEPNHPAFVDVTTRKLIEVIEACDGRTLGLFTSYKAVNAAYNAVRSHFGDRFLILKQGNLPPGELTRLFKEDVRSVLLATTSFWTGIDVPGEALTGLVIDRLPFGQPDDPVAIRIAEKDRNAFGRYTVPKSILTLRQGVGRLIRSQRDVGAVVILDRRLTTKGYGARYLRSLPVMSRASSTAAIAPFLRSRGVAA